MKRGKAVKTIFSVFGVSASSGIANRMADFISREEAQRLAARWNERAYEDGTMAKGRFYDVRPVEMDESVPAGKGQ